MAIAGVVAWIPLRRGEHPAAPASAIVVLPKVETLTDGSRVELNAESEIAVNYTADARRVTLRRGEAHFSVQKDPARPFIVSAGGVDVRAVGTAFAVRIAPATIAVLVTEGHVAVEKAAAITQPPRVMTSGSGHGMDPSPPIARLGAGDEVVIERNNGSAIVRTKSASPEERSERLAWRGARVEFTRASLAEAVALLNKFSSSSPRLVITDPELAAVCVTGVFRPDNKEGFVLLLEGGFGVKAERSGDTIALRAATVE